MADTTSSLDTSSTTHQPGGAGRTAPAGRSGSACPGRPAARTGSTGSAGTGRTPAELRVRRILCIPDRAPSATRSQAERLFSISIVLSALRCLVTYIAVPILGPLIGSSVSNSPAVGIPLGVLALVFDIRSVRRFWMADHPWRWRMTWVYIVVAAMVMSLLGLDITHLFS